MACKGMRKPRKMSAGGILASTATGAAGGVMGGPIGMGIGAVTGLATGIMGHIGEQKNKDAQERLMKEQGFQARKAQTQNYINQYGTTGYQNVPLMPMGGLIPYNSQTVELERGEPFMTPDGNIQQIPDDAPTHAQGGVVIDLPAGTKVLGKKKMGDKTFKQLGKKLRKAQQNYEKLVQDSPGTVQTRTAGLMKDKLYNKFNDLFKAQGEDIAPQLPMGGLIPYQDGGQINPTGRAAYMSDQNYSLTPEQIRMSQYGDVVDQQVVRDTTGNVTGYNRMFKDIPGGPEFVPVNQDREAQVSPSGKRLLSGSEIPKFFKGGEVYDPYNPPQFSNVRDELASYYTPRVPKTGILQSKMEVPNLSTSINYTPSIGDPTVTASSGLDPTLYQPRQANLPVPPVQETQPSYSLYQPEDNSGAALAVLASRVRPTATNLRPTGALMGGQTYQFGGGNAYDPVQTFAQNNPVTLDSPADTVADTGASPWTAVASLAPVAYNLIQGIQSPETTDIQTQRNPYLDQIRSTMRDRRYNIEPELEANRLAEATYYRNLREGAPSQAQYLAGLQAGQISKSRQDAAAIARKQNIDNQYLSEQAAMDAQLGATEAGRINQERYFEEQANAQSRAARRRMIGTGLGQLGQFAQTQQLMKGQRGADEIRLNMLEDLYQNYLVNRQGVTFKQP